MTLPTHQRPAAPARRANRGQDSYDGIEPLLAELAGLAEHDPRRRALRELCLRRCLPLADHIARRFTGRGETYDDLHQSASLGLVLAVDRYDPARGTSFLAFAVPTIMGEVRRHFRDRTWALRVPRRVKETQLAIGPVVERLSQHTGRMPTTVEIALELELDPVEVTQALLASKAYRTNPIDSPADDPAGGPVSANITEALGATDPAYELCEDALAVAPLLRKLPERDRRVLYLRFFENRTQAQIAAEFGVSQMHISRILSRTLAALHARALRD
ncbi:SigB/SigF/SigG family RNA polymerase sigma factor [Nocardia asteroides]|uniref:SigB/SigF/SigG family RNA polymerase sigma factor n=1 Tax=Nocardia asteroides TaxID=1824 RepID=UPI001E3F6434|nr:SigB/SigF/SigG family RNA polymerase sigma factor [Nocardia asteroides]UGT61597.1 SigB/SigF/SigG family RNA polymerase sigma factor [Nocardia asteroides]